MATLPSTLKEEPDLTGTLVHYAVLSLLGPAWYCCGQLAQRAKLPQITGYVIGGIICGPSGLNLLRNEAQQTLLAIDHSCLAIIAVTAGAELHFDSIKRVHKQVISITLWISACTWICVFSVMMLLVPYIPFKAAINRRHVASVASLAGMLMVARSPASAIAVVKETGGKGPYCSLILAVVVMKDVLVFVCFAVNLEFTRMLQMSKEGESMHMGQMMHPFVSLGSSTLLGVGSGVLLSAYVGSRFSMWAPLAPAARRLPPYISQRIKTLGVASSAVLIFWLSHKMGAEPLLACVMTGIVTANYRRQDPSKVPHEDAADHMARLMTVVNTTFFGLAGSSLRLGALLATTWIAFLVWGSRLLGICAGSWMGAWLGGTPPDTRRKIWQGMVTQAGVAMGLAKTVATRFPTWGPEFATLMVAIILLNLCVGPPLFRSAIYSAGEARSQSSIELQATAKSDGSSPRSPQEHHKEEGSASMAEKGMSRNVNTSLGARSAGL